MGGLPVKPKVQGYIRQEVFDKFQEYCKSNRLSQSAGLEVVIAEFFGIKKEVTEQNEKITSSTTYIEICNILTSEVEKLNERISFLERWRLDLEDISANILNANLACLLANPVANPDGAVADTPANLIHREADTFTGIADTLANLDAKPGAGIAEKSHENLPTKGAIALASSDRSDHLTRKELGELLGVSHESIRVWEQRGDLKKRGWELVEGTGSSPKNPRLYREIDPRVFDAQT